MLKRTVIIALSLLCSFAFIACEEKDGLWDPIQITVNGSRCKSSTFNVPESGGEFKLFSKNYGEMWLNAVKENGQTIWPENGDNWTDYRDIHLMNEWYKIQYDESGNIVVKIHSKEKSSASRQLTFNVECGDAFGYITLLQE